MAKHAEDKNHNFLFIITILGVLVILSIIIYFYVYPYFNTELNIKNSNNSNNNTAPDTNIQHNSTNYKIFDDAPYLYSDEFDLTVDNGFSTINGKLFNTSNEIVTDLNCLYTLKDSNNNTIYEFTIYANQIEPQDSFGFTSVVILDLSNVEDYSVKLYNK